VEIVLLDNLGYLLGGERITYNDNEPLPWPIKPKVCGLARFLPAHGSHSSKQKSCQKGL